ncbi:hypothetical protein [Neoroseomonas rubea]|uniref:hypothetical protein n=1 Tax=Neoroseomonas rubea TaxID=2748666 RepID=UPI0018DF932E|nr:hypothetical protein [Roseomonas rubea]
MSQQTTRPAGEGTGIDLSQFDVAQVVFEATGGGHGAPPPNGGTDPSLLPAPVRDGTWVAGDGRTPDGTDPADTFDPGTITDPLRDFSLTTDPVMPDNPLLPMMEEEAKPDFANGGPEGAAIGPGGAALVLALVLLGVGVVAYNVNDDVKASVDALAADIASAFDNWVSGGGDDAEQPGPKKFTSDPSKGKALKDFDRLPQYMTDPDAQGDATDGGAVLAQIFADLIGDRDPTGLATRPEGFGSGDGTLDALNGGRLDRLGKLMDGLKGYGVDATDGLTGEEMMALSKALGFEDALATMPFMAEDPQRVLFEASEVERIAVATDTILTIDLGGDWW